jgi:membrane protein DedA with SNARE-associated domain
LGGIEHALVQSLTNFVSTVGWLGVFIAMAIESACIPLPSEVTMPLAGWILVDGNEPTWLWILFAGFVGAAGNVVGSWVAYWIGQKGGRPFLEKYGKYVLITQKDLDRADTWFAKYGEPAVFFSRLLPVIRTFISFPAGVVGMDLRRFTLLTFVGSLIWSTVLAWLGYLFGANYEQIRQVMRPFDIPIIMIVLALVIFYVYRKVREMRAEARRRQAETQQ